MTAGGKEAFPFNELPEGRRGTFNEITGTLLYLVGKSGGYTNGLVQVVDGGRLSVMPSTY
jgi:hypothetical protein